MKKEYIRILPALVVDQVFVRALLVGRVLQAHLEDFGIVEQLLVEAQDFLVLAVHGWRHDCTRNKIGTKKKDGDGSRRSQVEFWSEGRLYALLQAAILNGEWRRPLSRRLKAAT
jgi:hypothetical protein